MSVYVEENLHSFSTIIYFGLRGDAYFSVADQRLTALDSEITLDPPSISIERPDWNLI